MNLAPSIEAIDKKSVHHLCSGQVVLSLATAVKELLENSLDAQATHIDVRLVEHGVDVIEVSDNGTGIRPCDFEALALKHYTSKLKSFEDLQSLTTFGFRGEALSSLAALSCLEVTTRHLDEEIASKLIFDSDGVLTSQSAHARECGTTVSISNLFHTLPVRRKELVRNIKKEFSKLCNVLYAYAMGSDNVRFNVVHHTSKQKRNLILSTTGKCNKKDIICSIFGPRQSQDLCTIEQHTPTDEVVEQFRAAVPNEGLGLFTLAGFISSAQSGGGRCSKDRQFLFVNKRPFDSEKVLKLVNEIYRTFNKNEYPFLILEITTSANALDVNVTPDKRQVMIQHEKFLQAVIVTSLQKTLEHSAMSYLRNGAMPLSQTFTCKDRYATRLEISSQVCENRDMSTSRVGGCDDLPVPGCARKNTDVVEVPAADGALSTGAENCAPAGRCDVRSIDADNHVLARGGSLTSIDPLIGVGPAQCNELPFDSVDVFGDDRPRIACPGNLEENENRCGLTTHDSDKRGPLIMPRSYNAKRACDKLVSRKSVSSSSSVFDTFARKGSPDIGDHASANGSSWDKNSKKSQLCVPHPCLVKKIRSSASFDLQRLSWRVKQYAGKSSHLKLQGSGFVAKIAPADNKTAEDELARYVSKEMFLRMEVVGQFNLGFIVAKLKSDLFLIDQHASDEKYRFEFLQSKEKLRSQRLIKPVSMHLPVNLHETLVNNIDIFKANGFDFNLQAASNDTSGMEGLDSRLELTCVPACGGWNFGVDDVEELVNMLSDTSGVMCRPSRVRQMFASRACRSSVMVGTALDRRQMTIHVRHMAELDHPWNCPHGRPTMRHLICLDRVTSAV